MVWLTPWFLERQGSLANPYPDPVVYVGAWSRAGTLFRLAEQCFWNITYLEHVVCTQSKYPEQWELQLKTWIQSLTTSFLIL